MELTLKSTALFSALIMTGLSAGLFYAWSVSVIPGTQKVSDATYMETMQSINRAILNPAFFLIFFGSLVLLGLSTIFHFKGGTSFWLLLSASIVYLFGTFGVTAFGNVPLNNQLEALDLSNLAIDKMSEFRAFYEQHWNQWHLVRTIFSVLSFALTALAIFTYTNSNQ